MHSKIISIIICASFFYSTTSAKTVKFNLNTESFENQIQDIINNVSNFPKTDRVFITLDPGYYSISKTIEIKDYDCRIVFCGSKKKTTVISGSIEVSGWTVMEDGLWQTKLPSEIAGSYIPDQLYVNGKRAIRARMPNKGVFLLENGGKDKSIYEVELRKNDYASLPQLRNEDIGILSIYHKWTVSKRFISNYSREENKLFFEGKDFPDHNKPGRGASVIIENTKGCLDEPGEWYVDKNNIIYYYPKADETLENTSFRIPVVEKLFSIESGEVSFKNIVFEHTTYQITTGGVEFDQAASGMSAAIEVDNAMNIVFEDCEIRNISNYGLWIRKNCKNGSIKRSYFHNIGGGAIKIGTIEKIDNIHLTTHVRVENNIVSYYGQLIEEAVGVHLLNAADCMICHNDIHFGGYTGISLGWSWGYGHSPSKRNNVSYNRITHIGSGLLSDLAGIYTLGKSEGTHIHHNVLSDIVSGDYRGWGIYLDEGTTGVVVEKNLVYRTTSGGFHQHFGNDNIVRNNIFAWGVQSQFVLSKVKNEYEEHPLLFEKNIVLFKNGLLMSGAGVINERFIARNNCYWSTTNEIPKVGNYTLENWMKTRDLGSVFQNPHFRAPDNSDFKLKNKSICKKIGFEEFDYKNAGVYGKRKWKTLALKTSNEN